MFSNLQKSKTFFNFRDSKNEGSPRIEITQLAASLSSVKDYERPKLIHAKTAFNLSSKEYSRESRAFIQPKTDRLLTKQKTSFEGTFRSAPLQYINLVSKSALVPKEPRTYSFISNKSKSYNEIKKIIFQAKPFKENTIITNSKSIEILNEIPVHSEPEKIESKEEIAEDLFIEMVVKEDENNIVKSNKLNEIFFQKKNVNKKKKHFQEFSNENQKIEEDKYANSIGDDWLIKWSILNNASLKRHEDIFDHFDILNIGHLSGPLLADAITATHKLSNTKMNYLFNVLNLCEIDPFKRGANLKMFKIITSLANKINKLDDEWFFNLLPQLDIFSVENKAFKIRSLWNYLVNSKTKSLSIKDLIIEFEAGGVTREHVEYAKKKFEDNLYFDITDYVTYIPLFLYIHDRIIKDPFGKYDEI